MAALKAKVTLTTIKDLGVGETIYDTEIKGFGIRRQTGPVSYFVKTRIKGRQRWITIGKHGSPWTPDTARKEARSILAEVDKGFDRLAAKKQASAASTFDDVAKKFIEIYGPKLKPRTLEEYQKLIHRYLVPKFGTFRIDAIERSDVAHAHAKWAEHPRTANHALAVMSKIMSWAEEQQYRPAQSNPCLKLKKYREVKRQRYLSNSEIERLGQALVAAETEGQISVYAAAAIRLLVFTGARLTEILTLKWSYVDLNRRILLLPDSKTGEKTIPLNSPAIEVLGKIPRLDGNEHVIVGHRAGNSMVDIFKPWSIVRALAKLDDVRIHDLRHTFASVAAANGASLPMIGRMLGHLEPRTTQRYAHLGDDPIAMLSEETANRISSSLSGSR